MRTFLYDEADGLKQGVALEALVPQIGQRGVTFWIDLDAAPPEEIKRIGELFNFHALAIEDAIIVQQRPKIDIYENCLFIALRDPDVDRIAKGMKALELDLFIGRNFLITVHQEKMSAVEHTATRLTEDAAERIIGRGPDFLAHTIVDLLVDNHLHILDWLDEEITQREEALFESASPEELQQIIRLRKNILYLQRILGPQLEVIRRLSGEELPFIKKSLRIYFRDVYDHLARVNDIVINYREIVATDMGLHQALIANKLNEIMKVLTLIAVIILPVTLIASIYGMNFAHMPELQWRYGYLWALGLMALTGGGMYWWFKRRGWL